MTTEFTVVGTGPANAYRRMRRLQVTSVASAHRVGNPWCWSPRYMVPELSRRHGVRQRNHTAAAAGMRYPTSVPVRATGSSGSRW